MIKITFSGDIMLKSQILEFYAKNKNYKFDEIFGDIKEKLKTSDFSVGNLETPISEKIVDYKAEQYRFTSPIQFAQAVKDAGFDLVTTANNHCLDNGIEGAKTTVECLNKINLDNTGISINENNVFIKEINGVKFAFLSYTYGTNAFSNNVYLQRNSDIKVNLLQNQELSNRFTRIIYNGNAIYIKLIRKLFRKVGLLQFNKQIFERKEFSLLKRRKIIKDIKYCKKNKVDYIIMCAHIGGQYSKEPTNYSKKITKYLFKNGIDMIIGNHEHVIHNCEINNNGKLIAYCLGNCVGIAGVLEAPFDKMSEYSILVNTYFDNENKKIKLCRVTFTILKTVLDKKCGDKALKVKSLYDLINNCDNEIEKKKLISDYNKICRIVLNSEFDNFKLEEEIEIK